MIEGYTTEGHRVLISREAVVEVYAGGQEGYNFWCNVQTVTGAVHRFSGPSAEKVYKALRLEEPGDA